MPEPGLSDHFQEKTIKKNNLCNVTSETHWLAANVAANGMGDASAAQAEDSANPMSYKRPSLTLPFWHESARHSRVERAPKRKCAAPTAVRQASGSSRSARKTRSPDVRTSLHRRTTVAGTPSRRICSRTHARRTPARVTGRRQEAECAQRAPPQGEAVQEG